MEMAYDQNGEPDKKSGFDHLPDALGYLVHYEMLVYRPAHKAPHIPGKNMKTLKNSDVFVSVIRQKYRHCLQQRCFTFCLSVSKTY